MAMLKPISRILHTFLFLTLIGAFGSSIYFIKTAPRVMPIPVVTPTAVPSVPPAFKAIPDAGSASWFMLQPGLERRLIRIYNDQNQPVESVYIWRLDQKSFRLDVAFSETPKSLESWQRETNAALVMNGGYFSVENEKYFPDGLTIVNGKPFGRSFNGFGGVLAINPFRAELRWLVEKPYNAYEPLQAALQSFPILVKPGGQLGFGAEREDHKKARRTVVAQDREGRILFIVAPEGYFTLHQLSVYLTESDLNLDVAVNLDGGGSTGILVANPREIIPSKTSLPFVILVYPR
ncbi:MAG TPA: phosphodiester glycosidase family protein [Anaerolineales bacterium]|nr:phosphodiester glycosidase family protein [Anaerolineales bacterium]